MTVAPHAIISANLFVQTATSGFANYAYTDITFLQTNNVTRNAETILKLKMRNATSGMIDVFCANMFVNSQVVFRVCMALATSAIKHRDGT